MPESGPRGPQATFRPANRTFVMVSEGIFANFHRRWRALDRLWPACGDPQYVAALSELRDAGREELRAEVRRDAEFAPGPFLIPV